FRSEFKVGRKCKVGAQGGDDAFPGLGREDGRSAAAKVDRVQQRSAGSLVAMRCKSAFSLPLLRAERDFGNDGIGVAAFRFGVVDEAVEIAVGADLRAEGNMEIAGERHRGKIISGAAGVTRRIA